MDAVPSMLEYIVRGAASAVLPMNLLVMFLGLIVGIVGGMLPGITTVTAVALFVPFTFSMPPDMALIGLGGVFCGAMYGGANAAILINTPGTPVIPLSYRAGPKKPVTSPCSLRSSAAFSEPSCSCCSSSRCPSWP